MGPHPMSEDQDFYILGSTLFEDTLTKDTAFLCKCFLEKKIKMFLYIFLCKMLPPP